MVYLHKETGSIDTKDGWISSYATEELEQRRITAEQAFNEDVENTLIEIDIDNFTEEEAILMFGKELVDSVKSENCDVANRLTDGTGWDGFVEFSASVRIESDNPYNREYLTVYYYQKKEDVDSVEDLGDLNWEIDHYSLN